MARKTPAYRLASPTVAIRHEADGQYAFVTLPEDSLVTIYSEPGITGLVIVQWKGETISMFLRDIKERGAPVA